MFYSQFILAKKGPLGTIWIAAHLERKLRKNQVADTDIGVSVDSILFPDAPIALRLSSHLLLGVVRIYSKKVNYLFNDCSEALIKIKHAFRSTAVDLPPEESTAPYHSITLPENFDLDNFELPDSAFLDSNFVDHHVSTREQITLQDTVNETAFPTSKFGLDERFGDEDASQIDLELDEELFMDKADPPEHDEVRMISKNSGLYHGETSVPSTSKAVDVQFGGDVEKYNDTSNELSELLSNNFDKSAFSVAEDVKKEASSSHRHGYATQTPDLNEIFQPDCPTSLEKHIPLTPNDVQTPCSVELAQEPSTPALLEVVPSHLQEDPVLSPQEKADTCVESSKPRSITSPHMEIDSSEAGNKTIHASTELDIKYEESVQGLHLSPALIRSVSESITPTCPNWNSGTDNAQFVSAVEYEVNNISTADRRLVNDGAISTSLLSHEASALMPPPKLVASFPATFKSSTDNMDASGAVLHVAMKGSNDSTEIANSGHLQDARSCLGTSTSGSDLFSSPCNSKLHIPSSSFIQTAPIESELATSNIHTDKMDVSGVNLDLEKAPIKNSNEKSSPRHGEVGDSDFSTSMAGSDFFLRSCSSNLHLPNTLFVDGALGGNSEFPIGDHCFSQKTSRREEVQNINRHFEVQDDDRFNYLEGQDTSGYTTSDFKYGGRKPVEQLSTGVMSKVSHLDNEMCSPSSEFLGPEKMLASTFDDFSTYQVLQASDKGLMQSDGIADRNSSPFSRKRHLLDSPTVPQTSSSAKSSEYPRTKSRSGYVLDGNDVLTTILDERSAPSLKTGSIPPLTSKTNSVLPLSSKTGSVLPVSKLSSQKRPRAIPKVVLSKKRKVLVDDAMSLHADVIRQQLINTEDIRRMRKKAPCSRPEIWKIYIGAMEEDVFDRSILAGISVELNSSSNLKDDTPKDPSFLELNSQAKTSENTGSSRVSGIFRDMGDKQMNHRILSAGTVDSSSPSSITESVSVQTHESDMLDHLKKLPVQPQAGPFRKDQTSLTGQSRVSEFLNEGSTKEFNEKISSVNNMTSRNEIPSNITAPATLKAHQFGAQCGTHVQLPKVPIHSRVGPSSNNQAGVLGSSTGFEFINEINDNEINERVSSVHRNSPSSLNSSVTVQVHEVGAQHDLYDQLRNLPVQPQVGSLKNKQASMIRGMQPDAEICRTSIIQGTTIPENITPAKSSGETGMNMKSNERNSSLSSIVNRNFGLQSHEDDAHYDIYGQLNKLPVQQDVLSFNNDHAPVIREMQFDIETHPTIIQELTIPETVKSFSPVEKLAVQSSNQVEYDTRAKMFGVTGSSRLLPFSSAMGETEMIESISSDPRRINRSFGSASMTASVSEQPYDDGTHYDHYGQSNNLPVQPQVGSMIRATLPRVGAQPHSIIQEIHIPQIGSSNSSIEKITDKSVAPQVGFNNFDVPYDPHCLIEKLPVQLESGSFRDDQMFDAVPQANSIILEPPIPEIDKNALETFSNKSISLTRSPLKPLNTPNEVSDRTIGDSAVEPFATQFHVQAGDAVINTRGKAGNAMHTGHLESIYTNNGNTGTKILYKQSHMLEETVSSAVVVDADGTVDALGDRGRLVSDATCATQNEGDTRPVSGVQCTEHTPSTVGIDNSINDCNVEGEMGVDNMSLDIPVGRESNDFCSAIDDNYPGFLNEDYEDAVVDEADANMSNSENAQSLENTGWSARTRGVAKYLKNLFDEESGQGRTSVAMNRLLVGKTRKEASRMFFETLVLKTRDYIQVEQKHPYDWIDITPRTKLLKSDF